MEPRSIKPIGHSSVHKICSGQVVLTLATAIKELVENSLDAGATIIEVKLKEYGSELIEVIDNGKGVKESDFQGITLKHYTSKISDFSDVQFVSTFGFRGEALSSLCALSDVEIVTCHSDATVGSLLVYDHNGKLVKCSPTHRQVGTTVILKNLFYTLPVRHKEFHRNVRREYAKMIQLLTAYCLISINRRITCTHTTGKGKKAVVLSTNSCKTVKDNIACIFGSKQADNLMAFVHHVPSEADLVEYMLPPSAVERCSIFHMEGFISSCTHGEGRSSADRQFYFVDGRPCDLPKVSKLVNEVYHSFNKTQYPFIFVNITLQSGSVDVNVTPDKRQIMIPDEKLLLCIVKASLHQMYQPMQTRVASAGSLSFFSVGLPLQQQVQKTSLSETEEEGDSLKRKAEEGGSPAAKSARPEDEVTHPLQDASDSGFGSQETSRVALTRPFDEEKSGDRTLDQILRKAYRDGGRRTRPDRATGRVRHRAADSAAVSRPAEERGLCSSAVSRPSERGLYTAAVVSGPSEERGPDVDEPRPRRRRARTVAFAMDAVKRSGKGSTATGEGPQSYRRFRCKISPSENQSAEEELGRHIRKEDFSEMRVVGQFNLGFVVARLRDDLFIVDQHATDEKYHFEMLRRDHQLETQPLVSPQTLNLSAASEAVLLDHLPVFEKSGFRFAVEETRPVGTRVRLTSVPVGHNWTFGKEDVDEMIFMLTDNPVTVVRPSRVNQMFASRACRKSVMIGTALSPHSMNKLIRHMGEIEQPWNCPHGRPTIRHLLSLDLLKSMSREG